MNSRTLHDRVESSPANHFNAIRLALSMVVVAYHCLSVLGRQDSWRDPIARLTGDVFNSGGLAVISFFVISGFLITQSWLRSPAILPYLWKRAARIYPGYLVAVVVSALIFGPLIVEDRPSYWKGLASVRFVATALLIRFDFPDSFMAINGSLWSIGYEAWCYLAILLLGVLGLFRHRGFVLGCLVVCLLLIVAPGEFGVKLPGSSLHRVFGWPASWPVLMASFLSGALLHLYRDRVAYSPWASLAALGGLLASVGFAPDRVLPIVLPMLWAYLLIYLAYLPGAIRHPEASRRLDLSYGVYLYGFPIQTLMAKYVGANVNPIGLFLIVTPAVGLAAFASWRLIEEPCLRAKPRRKSRPPADSFAGVGSDERTA